MPNLLDKNKTGVLGLFWKAARIGSQTKIFTPSSYYTILIVKKYYFIMHQLVLYFVNNVLN